MTRTEIIAQLKKYFEIRELVCKHTFQSFGERSWQFIGTQFLHTILVLRTEILKNGMICNNYHRGGGYTQRGLRCNICQIPKDKTTSNKIYLSAHCTGVACDFTVMNMTAEQARKLIIAEQDKLPYPVRLENGVSWLHVDGYDPTNGAKKVVLFNA